MEYSGRNVCCGAGEGIRSASKVSSLRILRQKIRSIAKANADCIVDICPFCHLQFDLGQIEIKEKFGDNYNIPVLHYSQLLGLALGMSQAELGLNNQYIRIKRDICENTKNIIMQ